MVPAEPATKLVPMLPSDKAGVLVPVPVFVVVRVNELIALFVPIPPVTEIDPVPDVIEKV